MKVGEIVKIQTGLRVPEDVYDDLQARAKKMGVSINQLILMLISVGMKFLDEGIIPQKSE